MLLHPCKCVHLRACNTIAIAPPTKGHVCLHVVLMCTSLEDLFVHTLGPEIYLPADLWMIYIGVNNIWFKQYLFWDIWKTIQVLYKPLLSCQISLDKRDLNTIYFISMNIMLEVLQGNISLVTVSTCMLVFVEFSVGLLVPMHSSNYQQITS